MNKKHYILPSIAILLITSLVFALIPPPPVNQNMGVYDTLFANFTEGKCRDCHASGVPERHHMLLPTGEYGCSNCHPVVTVNGSPHITMLRDCMQCHDATFNGMTIPRPHHETQDAQDRHCSFCHGNLVDDYDDGHYIPAYNISLVTPDTNYKVINSTTGKKWGGCEACHEQNLTMEPPIAFNNKTHHRLGSLSGFNPPNNSKCLQCHDLHSGQYGSDSVRYCERCHATKSLHNIQWDYVNTSGTSGSGHIGNNWDCSGCHAWYVAGGAAPGTSVIIPIIDSLSTGKVFEGSTTVLTIHGSNFVTTVDGVTHSSVVVIKGGANPTTITPDYITSNKMVVTIPVLGKGAYGIYALKGASVKSNKLSITAVPGVTIGSAKKTGTNVVITGSGFGQYDPVYESMVNVTIQNIGKRDVVTVRNVEITSWSDTLIEVTSSDAMVGDTATVNSIYGISSVKVTETGGGKK